MGELGSKSWVCENHSSYTHAFFKKISNALRRGCIKFYWFSKIHFFYNFDWSSLFFDLSKLRLKISVSLCLVRLIELVFRSIKHRESSFFFLKTVFDSFKTFFQIFFKLSSLSPTWQGSTEDFLSFFNHCKVFLSQGR